ncbi:hypothetical protein CPB85DRAFT_1247767 [Mucidula mucida]|nr:hypothetical protein CPB85DRAFT_1247767 [Mucidula mucida]
MPETLKINVMVHGNSTSVSWIVEILPLDAKNHPPMSRLARRADLLMSMYYLVIYRVVSPRKVSGRRWVHLLVSWIFLAEIVQTLTATIDAFRDFGTGWGQMKQVEHIGRLLWLSVSVMTALVSRRKYLRVETIGCVQAGAGLWAGALGKKVGILEQLADESFVTTAVWLGGTVLVLFLTYRRYNYHLAPAITLCKLCSNSLMVVLNSHVMIISHREPLAPSTFSILDTPSMAVRMQNMALNQNNIEEDAKRTFCRAIPPLTG